MKWVATVKALAAARAAAGPPPPSYSMPGPAPQLLTVREAAAYARVSEPTVRRWIRQQGLPAHKAGPAKQARVRIDKAELVRFLCIIDQS